MRFVAVISIVAGCGFSTTLPTGSSPSVEEDAGIDAIAIDDYVPRWQLAETIVIDTASATGRRSQMTLANGVMYRLKVSGTITNVIDAFQGDADWYDFAAPKDNGCCEDIGLGIDDTIVNDMNTKPDWGTYNASHVYEAMWPGKGTTILALFQDTYYGNNIGNLTLEIYELR